MTQRGPLMTGLRQVAVLWLGRGSGLGGRGGGGLRRPSPAGRVRRKRENGGIGGRGGMEG